MTRLRESLRRRIVGQEEVITQTLAAILAEGHCLLVGLPGLAKTLLVSSIAELLDLEFKRIQFTPDLMPSDITGASIIADDGTGRRDFRFLKGPIFANVILADEINRTPPKTQAALIEAMEERQVSCAGRRLRLERPFFVLATQNPIELQGTYPLPVSQLDRFSFKITIYYPAGSDEFRMLVMTTSTYAARLEKVFSREEVVDLLDLTRKVEVERQLLEYASRIVRSTRPASPGAPWSAREYIAWGGGPRAVQALLAGARAFAVLEGRSAVTPEDIHRAVVPALRHRIILRYHAEAEGMRIDDIVLRILEGLPGSLYRPPPAPAAARKGLIARLLGR
ncbi:MAG: AAA family ATPase [Planctomycetes bacterium]|nr:AAA family ATPase [Planctomycetota bacterium]